MISNNCQMFHKLTACNYSYIQLIDFNARFYSPTLGRFIQPDSVVPDWTNSQSLNRFSYAYNNPIKYIDPSGNIPEWECGFSYGGCGTEGELHDNSDSEGKNPKLDLMDDWELEKDIDYEAKRQKHIEYCASVNWAVPQCYYIPDDFCDENPYAPECSHFMDGNPSPQSPYYVRNADYGTFSFGTAILNPFTLTFVGWHFNLTKDRYNQWYIGFGLDIGDSTLGADASLVWGSAKTILPPDKLQDYVSGFSVDYGIGFFGYGGGSTNIPGGTNFEAGLASPQGGLGFTYVWALP